MIELRDAIIGEIDCVVTRYEEGVDPGQIADAILAIPMIAAALAHQRRDSDTRPKDGDAKLGSTRE